MKDFDELKEIWGQPSKPLADIGGLIKRSKANQYKLMRTQLLGGLVLILTGVVIVGIGLLKMVVFKSNLTYWGMGVIALIPVLQGLVNLYTYKRLKALNITETPTAHLKKWEEYYAFRQWLVGFNAPTYFILLNLGFALYFIEILGYMSLNIRLIVIAAYLAWMLFAYFYLGSRSKKKERQKIEAIINNLKNIECQLS